MKRLFIISAVAVLIVAFSVSATIINIPADYPTIQQGIDASIERDTVLVAEGYYYERINYYGKRILLTSDFMVNGDTLHIYNTVIDADTAVIGVADTGCVVCFVNGEDSTSILQGFTLRNGIGLLWGERSGGAIFIYNSGPTVRYNVIRNNNVILEGGGIECHTSSATIQYNRIFDNTSATIGGGISCYSSDLKIAHNNILNNFAGVWGGGITCLESDAIISNNNIQNNSSTWENGGAIYCLFSNAIIDNNLLVNNYADSLAGGIFNHSSNLVIINNALIDNYSIYGGHDIVAVDTGAIYACNNIIWAYSGIQADRIIVDDTSITEIFYNNILGGWPGIGNIDLDPLFRDPTNGDFHLMSVACGDSADSPCIDAGDPDILDSLLDCSWGLGSSRSDMGAYGGGDSVTVGIVEELPIVPVQFILLQNYPNPFNAETTIKFIIPESEVVCLTVYDLLGRQIETLLDGYKQTGVHTVTFDASHLASGVYFYRLQAGERVETKRMVLLK